MLFLSCDATEKPELKVTLWAGDSAHSSITRSQENRRIYCNDPVFDDYVCMTYSDYESIVRLWDSCVITKTEFNKYEKALKTIDKAKSFSADNDTIKMLKQITRSQHLNSTIKSVSNTVKSVLMKKV